jgi:hypothetical protein
MADSVIDRRATSSPYIFSGVIGRMGASTVPSVPVDANTAIVAVDDVARAPPGLSSFAGREVTVQLLEPLGPGRYVFFAEPMAIGGGIAVRERAHLEAPAQAAVREQVTSMIESDYAAAAGERLVGATLVALGTIGEVRSLNAEDEREEGVPWAEAPLRVERVLKGDASLTEVNLVGPRYATSRLPRTPPLRPHLRAIFFLRAPPPEAEESLSRSRGPGPLFFIADTQDVHPAERLATLEALLRNPSLGEPR